MERFADCESERRREASGHRYRGNPPLRWKRNYVLLDRLPVEGQPGVEIKGGREYVCELACRAWRERERRSGGSPETAAWLDRLRRTDICGEEQNAIRQSKEQRWTVCKSGLAVGYGSRELGEEHASGFPRVDYERVGHRRVPGFDFHVAAGSWAMVRSNEKECDGRLLEMGHFEGPK